MRTCSCGAEASCSETGQQDTAYGAMSSQPGYLSARTFWQLTSSGFPDTMHETNLLADDGSADVYKTLADYVALQV